MDNNETLAISIKDLWFSYGNETIISGFNLSLKQREFLGIIGPNGGGKTTLIKLILGLLKPHRGAIEIFGAPLEKVRYRLGYVPQETNPNKSFPISVFDVVLMGRLGRRRPGRNFTRDDREKTIQSLEKADMLENRNKLINELSGGQRQRVNIARALCSEPDILFLDEPTANIDSKAETSIYDLLHELNHKITIVMITHDIDMLSRHVKSIACINRKLVLYGEGRVTEEIKRFAYTCQLSSEGGHNKHD